jgi:hypothetical protein
MREPLFLHSTINPSFRPKRKGGAPGELARWGASEVEKPAVLSFTAANTSSKGTFYAVYLIRRHTTMLRLEPSSLHPIATDLHIAPAPSMVFAGIEKQPIALLIVTRP